MGPLVLQLQSRRRRRRVFSPFSEQGRKGPSSPHPTISCGFKVLVYVSS